MVILKPLVDRKFWTHKWDYSLKLNIAHPIKHFNIIRRMEIKGRPTGKNYKIHENMK